MGLRFYLVILLLLFGSCCYAEVKEYDGIWLMGFNLKHAVNKNIKFRIAVARSIDKQYIASTIMSGESVPAGLVPPQMLGYDPELKPISSNAKQAKLALKAAGYSTNDKRLKNLTMLHTSGVKTIEIANEIQKDLRRIGIRLKLIQIDAFDGGKWSEELANGSYDFFLMGYKADIDRLFTDDPATSKPDGYDLLSPLFRTGGPANFFGYSNTKFDQLLSKTEMLDRSLQIERHAKLMEANDLLSKDLPAIGLFYIEKL
ncbi:MAG: ABC transporter substrate-binding protein [Candidatus Margulisiibacteriota bacterium]